MHDKYTIPPGMEREWERRQQAVERLAQARIGLVIDPRQGRWGTSAVGGDWSMAPPAVPAAYAAAR